MKSTILFLFFLLHYQILTAQQIKKDSLLYRFSFEVSGSEMRESFVLNDPQDKISRAPIALYNFGFSLVYHKTNKTRFILDYQREKLGTDAIFARRAYQQPRGSADIFSKIGLFYEKDVFPIHQKSRWNLFLRGGSSFSIAHSPLGTGTSGILPPIGDTAEFIFEATNVERSVYASLGGAIGLRYNFSKRFFISGIISKMWNVTSNDVTTNDITYKSYELPMVSTANIRTTGNIFSTRISIGYNFHKNRKYAADRARKENLKVL
jgi:hypothetical protein